MQVYLETIGIAQVGYFDVGVPTVYSKVHLQAILHRRGA